MSIASLDLSVRASNCLEAAQINTVGELIKMDENQLMQLRSFGRTSLVEVKRKLAAIGHGPRLAARTADDRRFGR
jgi:DNA-directed RNA polymerase subunit alpha